MSSEERKPVVSTATATWVAAGLGVAAFVVGLVLLFKVFGWGYEVFQGVDSAFGHVATAAPVRSPGGPSPDAPAANPSPSGPTVEAEPGGTGLLIVAAVFVAKLVGLLILGWIAAMMASRGAGMVAAALGPRPSG